MLSFKRFLYIILIVAVLGGIFLIYNVNQSQPAGVSFLGHPTPEREFIETRQVDEGERPRVWLLGEPGEGPGREICGNVRQLCKDLHLTVAGEGELDLDKVEERDLVIFCGNSPSRCIDPVELEDFIAGGGRVILAAGLGEEETRLWPVFGIRKMSPGKDCHNLAFEKNLLPLQPERAWYDGDSGSARIEVSDSASVYIRDEGSGVPILYTHAWREGGVCLINGNFLADVRCMGLLTGAIAALMSDFVYPVLGVKTVFLDNFPEITPASDQLCRRAYGYSTEGFIRDVVWPAFQGISLRTDTPYTAVILTASSSEERLGTEDDALFTAIGKSVLQFGGELASGRPGDDVFPVITRGNSMKDGNLLAICSVLGAYGMVSHVFDVNRLIVRDGDAAWDVDKIQLGLFESEILDRASWLEGRTLSQTENDVQSYQAMDYGWTKSGGRMELDCSGAMKGQAFLYHTGSRVSGAEGLTCEDVGNGYYLLRIQDGHGIITLEEKK